MTRISFLDKALALQSFKDANAEMYQALAAIRDGDYKGASDFTISLSDQLFRKGTLSERQIEAWNRGNEKRKAAIAEAQNPVMIDLSKIEEMFDAVRERGYKKPTYRAEGFVLSIAPVTGANAGCLYLKAEDGGYVGKLRDGALSVSYEYRGQKATIAEKLAEIVADPLAAALRYGRRTGRCACCGRELTKHGSIDAGIGPICAEKWGF